MNNNTKEDFGSKKCDDCGNIGCVAKCCGPSSLVPEERTVYLCITCLRARGGCQKGEERSSLRSRFARGRG